MLHDVPVFFCDKKGGEKKLFCKNLDYKLWEFIEDKNKSKTHRRCNFRGHQGVRGE